MDLVSVTVILFLIMDPLGNVAIFLKMLKELDKRKQRWVIFREMLIALGVILFFYFIGDSLLHLLEVDDVSVRLASGIVLFLVAIKILFPSTPSMRESLQMKDPFLVPMAIPMIAGPSMLATVMLFSHLDDLNAILLPAILISWFLASGVLLLSPYLQKFLGTNGLLAVERLMGMVLVMLAIQRFMEGIHLFYAQQIPA